MLYVLKGAWREIYVLLFFPTIMNIIKWIKYTPESTGDEIYKYMMIGLGIIFASVSLFRLYEIGKREDSLDVMRRALRGRK